MGIIEEGKRDEGLQRLLGIIGELVKEMKDYRGFWVMGIIGEGKEDERVQKVMGLVGEGKEGKEDG